MPVEKSSLKYRKPMIIILILLIVSPIFGVILADIVGYHEPLDVAAEELGLKDLSEDNNWTPFFDYVIPGLPMEIGYIVAGLLGVGIILTIGLVLGQIVKTVEVKKLNS